jgi:predicted DNA-binding protein YlxM (UPF0122 family)
MEYKHDVIWRSKHPAVMGNEEDLLHLHLNDKISVSELSRRYNCDRKPIQTMIKNNGGKLRPSTSPKLEGREGEIIKMYVEEQLTVQTIRKKIGCSYQSIQNFLTRNNIKLRNAKESRQTKDGKFGEIPQKLTGIGELEDAIKLYNNGECLEVIASKYNISIRGIAEKLKRSGVHMRTSKESANLPNTHKRKRKTYMDRYGVENPMQAPSIYEKSNINRYKFKSCIINGRKFSRLQGFEPQAITYLIDNYEYDVYDIETSKLVPSIRYKLDNKNKVYHPDMYIPKDNLIVEIKCKYTYENDLGKNIAKRESTISKGFNFLTIIYSNNGKDVLEIMDSRI